MKLSRFFSQTWVIAVVAVTIGFIGGLYFPAPLRHTLKEAIGQETREHGDQYRFISPLLSCADPDLVALPNDKANDLEAALTELIESKKRTSALADAGIYFRELNGGPWIGVNYEASFTPGSLLKVPLAMSVYHLAESDPSLLSRQIEFTGGTPPATEHYAAPVIEPGTYSVEDLVSSALINSDNSATLLIAKIIGKDAIDASYMHLGITIPTSGTDYTTTVHTYAFFFRILFNATYLSRTDSEHLLSVLSETRFKDGIVAGVPAGTVVSHKFGERTLSDGGLVQLHDCGIVYKPGDPYLLCIMMRGKDFPSLASSIADVSKLVWRSLQ